MANFNVNSLSEYVKTNEDALIYSLVLGAKDGDTIPNLAKQLGVKTKERLNYLDLAVALQDGKECGFTPSGNTKFSERDIVTGQFKVQNHYCDKKLLGKFAEYQVKLAAGLVAEDMPFEKEIAEEVVRQVKLALEKLVWQGDTANGDLIDGFLKLDDGANEVAIASGTSIYDAIKAVVMAIPEDVIDKTTIFVSPANYRAFVQEMVEKNYYHYQSGEVENADLAFPGTNIKVHKTIGLSGKEKVIYASPYENMVFGTDMMGNEEQIKFWYDENTEMFKYSIRFNAGVQVLFPAAVTVGTIA